jgi:mxaJ protein
MCSPSRNRILPVTLAVLGAVGMTHAEAPSTQPAPTAQRVLRISIDPNNLPFSNEKGEGFENKIVELVARDLHATIEYHWRAQRRGFFRESLKANECDLVMGVPVAFERAEPTRAYYRSTYVFVSRADRQIDLKSFDDPKLHDLKIGLQMVGDDYDNTPPAQALANRGITKNLVGYTLYGDYQMPNPPERIMRALAAGEVDVAIIWGPLAGYFATRESGPLVVTPVAPEADADGMPYTFSIAMGARKGDVRLRDEVNGVIERRQAEINAILTEYGVPLLPMKQTSPTPAADHGATAAGAASNTSEKP